MSFSQLHREETSPDPLQYIRMIGVYQLCQRVTDHSSVKGKLSNGNQCGARTAGT